MNTKEYYHQRMYNYLRLKGSTSVSTLTVYKSTLDTILKHFEQPETADLLQIQNFALSLYKQTTMKKTFLFAALAMVLTITSCKKEETTNNTNCTNKLWITNNAGEAYNLYQNNVYKATISSGSSSFIIPDGYYTFRVEEVNYVFTQTKHTFAFSFSGCITQTYTFQ